jgi:hypothetical protein
VEREYTIPVSRDEYSCGKYHTFIQKEPGSIPWGVDPRLRDTALLRVIQRKVDKHYAKSADKPLWLVVFSTSTFLLTEYCEGGVCKKSDTLVSAIRYVAALEHCEFDEIWYTNMQTLPVGIWPIAGD